MKIRLLLFLCTYFLLQPLAKAQVELKSVLLFPLSEGVLAPPVVEISQQDLFLAFDVPGDDAPFINARIYHTSPAENSSVERAERSNLNAVEYLKQVNEFPLNDFFFSTGTRFNYVHYQLALPRVYLSGQYELQLLNTQTETVILKRYFWVYESLAEVEWLGQGADPARDGEQQGVSADVRILQQIMANQLPFVKVAFRQDYRTDRTLFADRTAGMLPSRQLLQYRASSSNLFFPSDNEFRQARVQQPINATLTPGVQQLQLLTDYPRGRMTFDRTQRDFAGQFFIDIGQPKDPLTTDYLAVDFTLNTKKEVQGDLYISGAFTNYQLLPQYKLDYNPAAASYQTTLLLREGLYDYHYVQLLPGATTPRTDFTEGAHRFAQHAYEAFVYFTPPGARYTQLIGYGRR